MQISLNNQGRKIEDKLLRHSALAKDHYKKSLSPNFEKKHLPRSFPFYVIEKIIWSANLPFQDVRTCSLAHEAFSFES